VILNCSLEEAEYTDANAFVNNGKSFFLKL
jgi:hypothetical protein